MRQRGSKGQRKGHVTRSYEQIVAARKSGSAPAEPAVAPVPDMRAGLAAPRAADTRTPMWGPQQQQQQQRGPSSLRVKVYSGELVSRASRGTHCDEVDGGDVSVSRWLSGDLSRTETIVRPPYLPRTIPEPGVRRTWTWLWVTAAAVGLAVWVAAPSATDAPAPMTSTPLAALAPEPEPFIVDDGPSVASEAGLVSTPSAPSVAGRTTSDEGARSVAAEDANAAKARELAALAQAIVLSEAMAHAEPVLVPPAPAPAGARASVEAKVAPRTAPHARAVVQRYDDVPPRAATGSVGAAPPREVEAARTGERYDDVPPLAAAGRAEEGEALPRAKASARELERRYDHVPPRAATQPVSYEAGTNEPPTPD